MISDEEFARIGYEAYCKSRKTGTGLSLPMWRELSEEVRAAWIVAAVTIMDSLSAAVLT